MSGRTASAPEGVSTRSAREPGAARRDSGTGMRAGDRPILPLWLRGGVLALVLGAVAIALATGPVGRPGGGTLAEHVRGPSVASRELHFVDVEDGGVSIVDAADGTEVRRLVRGEDGFVRGVMRGLANERKARGLGAETPFKVSLLADGSLWLDDPATRREVVLSAFGADNVAAFARLLPGAPGAPATTATGRAASREPHDS